ncbi:MULTISPECIES: TonB-dependent receptor [unclassified Pseudoxanthomonas]|uniref:TonB-dependent receptor domain-containing protein n=1 Tax=unclassified Pseudoxanthomonas TaxID=2645906 RepID=UPI0008F14127|nr:MULTISPECIES: TonB-dependent receptor [unclassified Pseudoxanthomonas]PPJ43856.1 TonB-dependent receptor [Pseudoxanthomonas sp. KAs_5_3]SFV36405.1 hemoglobin/transferrin/lactoferrin receptor protein [Pseudoxanthomonas sp. YR558]
MTPSFRSPFPRRTVLALQVGLLLAAPAAWAQSDATDATTELDKVVVVGAMTDVELDRQTIERTQAATLADLFRAVPSVSVGGGVGIAQKIYVRGLEDSMLNVTVDGAPQRGTLFHHVGRVSIEPELLENVDVQAGAGEATSGFGAIGGAIRFRTRNATDLLDEGEDVGGIIKAGWASNDGYRVSTTGFGRLHGDIGVLASFVHVDSDDYQDGDGHTLRGTGARQRLGFVKIGGDLNDTQRVTASYEVRREDGEFGQRPNWPVREGERLFPVEGERRTGVLNYGHALSEALELEATAYSTETEFTQDRYDRWGLYGADIDTWGFDLRGTWRTDAHRLVFGVEHRDDQVASRYLAPAAQWQPWAWDPAIGRFVESGQVWGVYVQDQWQATDALLLSAGARYDAYDLDLDTYGGGTDSDHVSFNVGGSYRISDAWTFNLSYAEAFRGKEIGDAFTLEQRPGRLTLAPGLQPETVENAEIGLQYDAGGFSASAVYYQMTIDDVILDQLGSGPAPQGATYYENVGRFRSDGVELRAGYRAGAFAVDGYYNRYDSKLNGHRIEGYEHIALGNSMGDNWNLTLRYDPSTRFGVQASVTRVEDLDNIEVLFREAELGWIDGTRRVDKPGYTVVDVFAHWQPFASQRFDLAFGVYNLFDRAYRSHASVADYSGIPDYEIVSGLNEPGRNVRVTASYRF